MADFSAVAKHIDEVILKQKHVPCFEIAVMQDHRLVYRYLAGYKDYDNTVPLTEDTLYHLYSCTKVVTAAVGMRLVEDGRLKLDEPVATYLPAYAKAFVLRDGKPTPPARTMTVRHLFTMTAGLNYDLHHEATLAYLNEHGDTAGTVGLANTFIERPLDFDPGERFQYSLCHDVLAAVIEVAAGKRFADLVGELVFTPLGMTDSYFHLTEAIRPRLAAKYQAFPGGKIVPVDNINDMVLTPHYDSGGAGIISSVNDYLKFADLLACGGVAENGYRLLKPETVKLLATEQLSDFAVQGDFSCAAGPGYGYALGVRTRTSTEGGKSPLGEFGWDGACGAYLMADPVNRLSIVMGMHVRSWPNCVAGEHAAVRDLVYKALGL